MTATAVVDTRDARPALAAAARRSAELIQAVGAMDLRIPRSEWTVGDTAAHLIYVLQGYAASARKEFDNWYAIEDLLPAQARTADRVAALNRIMIPAQPHRSPEAAARAINEAADGFLAATADLAPSDAVATPWYGDGATLTVAESTCLLLGEQVVHGYDIARAGHRKWPIAKSDALLILEAVHAMMPRMAKPELLRDAAVNYRIHPGGRADFVMRCGNGAIVVEAPGSQRIDCHIAADPATFILVGYGRISQWRAIGGAKMITWGRKPWLAFRLVSLMTHP